MKVKLLNAVERNRQHPATFTIPHVMDIIRLRPGDYAQVCAWAGDADAGGEERFWVEITGISNWVFTGTINNDLVRTHIHGLRDGDTIDFWTENILKLLFKTDLEKEQELERQKALN